MPRRKEIYVDMDAVLAEVGHFGRYQLRLFILLCFPVIFTAIANAQYVFNAASVNYRCFVPECESRPGNWKPGLWEEWALVKGSNCTRRKPVDGGKCEQAAFTGKEQQCNSWVYESNNSMAAEFNLACKEWQRMLVGSVHSFGIFTAYTFLGIVSDTLGRRLTLICMTVGGATIGLIRSFAISYVNYVILEYLEAILCGGIYSTSFILVVEMIGTHRRVLCSSILAIVFSTGLTLLALISWAFPYWRTMTRIVYTPAFIFLTYFFCLSESVRWLICQGKRDKAIYVLQRIASVNGKCVSIKTVNNVTAYITQESDAEEETPTPVWRQVCHSRILRTRVVICSFCWITTTFVYYGISINSVSLMGNKYINYAITAVFEIPGYALSNHLLDRFGRKRSIMASFFACGLLLFLMPVIPKSYNLYPTLFAKSFISMAFVSIYIFTMELFPTNARLMEACSLVGRIGSMLAPQTPLLIKIKLWLPYLIFGCMACVAAVLLIFIPETLRTHLPETIPQAENLRYASKTAVTGKTDDKPDSTSTVPNTISSEPDADSQATSSAAAKSSTKP